MPKTPGKSSQDAWIQVSERHVVELTETAEQLQEFLLGHPAGMDLEDWRQRLERAVWKLQISPLSRVVEQAELHAQELARTLGKVVQLETQGVDFEIPPTQCEALSRALIHAIRNAMDHGLETPSERQISGKPASGRIRISGELEGTRLQLCLRDDGRGPEFPKIVRIALEKGLIDDAKARALTQDEKIELLFRPGFSTRSASEATSVSGKGVGLEAVREGLAALGGLAAASVGDPKTGEGFELQLTLPVQIVGMEVWPVDVGGTRFWARPQSFEILQAGDSAAGLAALTRLGLEPQTAPVFLKAKAGGAAVPVDRIGAPEFRVFRRVDPIWISTGPKWIRHWMRAAAGEALACRSVPEPGMEGPGLGLLLDPGAWIRLVAASKN